jgi:hypothetical protein
MRFKRHKTTTAACILMPIKASASLDKNHLYILPNGVLHFFASVSTIFKKRKPRIIKATIL